MAFPRAEPNPAHPRRPDAKHQNERGNPDDALVEDEISLRSYMEAALGGILAINSGSRIVFMNGHTEQMFGYSRSELLGKSLTVLIPERFRERYASALSDYFAAPNVQLLGMEMDLIALRKNGEEFPVEIGLSFVEGQEGPIALGFVTDVTARKRDRDELARMNAELLRSNTQLEHFAQAVSEDLQEPLRVITGYLELIDRRYSGTMNAENKEFLDVVADGAARMKEHIGNLLNFSRVAAIASALQLVESEWIVQTAVDELKAKIGEKSAEVTWGPLPEIVAHASLLVQVFQNLISNGIKFNQDPTPRLRISAVRHDSEWVFSVRDNGIGIEARHFSRIFQMFERLHSADAYPGYGVGLAVSRKIVERHKGRMWFESKAGEGSTFYFSIPHPA
jgi:PAS domain S-box-containing protein